MQFLKFWDAWLIVEDAMEPSAKAWVAGQPFELQEQWLPLLAELDVKASNAENAIGCVGSTFVYFSQCFVIRKGMASSGLLLC